MKSVGRLAGQCFLKVGSRVVKQVVRYGWMRKTVNPLLHIDSIRFLLFYGLLDSLASPVHVIRRYFGQCFLSIIGESGSVCRSSSPKIGAVPRSTYGS